MGPPVALISGPGPVPPVAHNPSGIGLTAGVEPIPPPAQGPSGIGLTAGVGPVPPPDQGPSGIGLTAGVGPVPPPAQGSSSRDRRALLYWNKWYAVIQHVHQKTQVECYLRCDKRRHWFHRSQRRHLSKAQRLLCGRSRGRRS